ncbi:unnamed protein product [Rhizopus stolonifer]
MHSTTSSSQGSEDTPPRVALNRKVKSSIDENTNMTEALYFKKSQDTEEDSEDETYSYEQNMEVPSLMLDSKPEDSEAFNYPTYRHASYDGLIEQRSGRYHSLSLDDDSLSAQEALYTSAYVRPQRTRRSSSQADSILHALTPPSHALKARRFSKNNEASVGMSRKRSLVSEYQKEFNNHSAVSPRFMTLRKLSEVTTLPSYGYPYAQEVPPVPQIPSHLTPSSSPPLVPIAPPSPPSHSPVHGPKPDEDSMHHLWSNHQRAWEEQRNEAFGLAQDLVGRIEQDLQQRLAAMESVQSESLKARVAQLEKQHEIDVAIIKSQQMDKEKIESRLKQEEVKLSETKTQNKNLKAHVARLEQANRKMAKALEEQKKETREEGTTTWADMMESEDEAKKNVEVWAKKYRELEKTHQDFCSKLKQEKVGHQKWKAEREQEVRQLKQIESINRVQLDYLQTELKKSKPSHCACCKYPKNTQSYVAKDGYLTFTAEMNGQLSRYSVKIPQEQIKRSHLNPNAPAWKHT